VAMDSRTPCIDGVGTVYMHAAGCCKGAASAAVDLSNVWLGTQMICLSSLQALQGSC
jgi:hypothetical protein